MKTKDLDTLFDNEYPYEPPIQLLPKQKIMTPEAERFNGWAAMLGIVAALGALSLIHISEPTRRS